MKIIFVLLFSLSSLFAIAQSRAEILAVSGDTIQVSKKYVKGVSGVVLHKFDKTHEAILTTVVALGGDRLKITNERYIHNERLPAIATKPSVGDEVIMGYLYNRSLLIAPNGGTYKEVQSRYEQLEFINSDLLAFQLMVDGDKMPSKESIQNYCHQHAVGLVYIVAADMGYVVDVNSFQVLSVEEIDSYGPRQLPFFMRFEKIETNGAVDLLETVYAVVKAEILDEELDFEINYDRYYLEMLGE